MPTKKAKPMKWIEEKREGRTDRRYRAIEEGRTISVMNPMTLGNRKVKVGPPCENSKNGSWSCVTCKRDFQNGLQKDLHIQHGTHELVWLCYEHGPEDAVPASERES